jgi:protein TonB
MRDPEIFAQCLVDSDPAAARRSRGRRRKALLVAVVLEALVLAGLLLAPLAAPGSLPQRIIVRDLMPIPAAASPARRPPREAARAPRQTSSATAYTKEIFFQPPRIPKGFSAESADQNSTSLGPPSIGSEIPGGNDANGIPGGFGSRPMDPPPPPAAKKPSRPLKTSEGVEQALLIHRVDPVYPRVAIQTRLAGTVRLRAIIARDGSIQSLEALSGHPWLVKAALDAVQQWRYRPTLLHGEPVEVETSITVIFELQR